MEKAHPKPIRDQLCSMYVNLVMGLLFVCLTDNY